MQSDKIREKIKRGFDHGENKPRLSFMTFDDFIEYGKEHGMPWSFDFLWLPSNKRK